MYYVSLNNNNMANIFINDNLRLSRLGLQVKDSESQWTDLHCQQGRLDGACVVYSVVMAFNSDKLLDTTITVIDDDAKVINIDLKSDGCTITKKMAKSLGISEGDYISIYLKNKVYEIPVANVIDLFMSQTIYIPTSLYLEYDDVEYNRAFAVCEDDVDISLVNKKINKRKGIIFSRTKEQRRNTANEYLSLLKVVTNMIRIFAILLAMAVIYDLASLNYNERIRDVAQIKVLGYGYRKNMKIL